MSIRLRLTAWYVAIFGGIIVLLAVTVYLAVRAALRDQLDDALDNRAALVQRAVTFDEQGRPSLRFDDAGVLDDAYVRLYDATGEVVFDNSAGVTSARARDDDLDRAQEGQPRRHDVDTPDDEFRVVTMPLMRDGDVAGVLEAGESTDDVGETLGRLLFILGAAVPPAIAVAGLGGWWLSARALAPIDRITRTARDISGGTDLRRRLALDLPDDEVGRLARTFDGMLDRLEAAFERQRRFTGDASHELRTPLTAMRGQIEVALERDRDPEEYRRVLHAVNAQVDRMARLADGLLTLTRSDADALRLHPEAVDVGEMVESVAQQMRPAADAKGIDLRVEADGALTVEGDGDLLLQLTLNLVDNAVRYTGRGGVTVGWRRGPAPEIFVRDTGPGIPGEHRERIFERFFRGDAARSEGGAGLGLAISRAIAEAHDGTIHVESDAEGTTFIVRLPARRS